MTKTILMEKYPVFSLEITKDETDFTTVDAIIAYLQEKIAAHPFAVEIAVFDHYAHTASIPEHTLSEDIKAAKNLVFCFGKMLPQPAMMAIRPRSIGVSELENSFVINFLEVPNEKLHKVTEEWVKSIANNA